MNAFSKLSLNGKIIVSNLLSIFLCIAVGVFAMFQMRSLLKEFEFLGTVTFENVINEYEVAVSQREIQIIIFSLQGNKPDVATVEKAKRNFASSWIRLEQAIKKYENLPFAAGEETVWNEYKSKFIQPLKSTVDQIFDLYAGNDDSSFTKREQLIANTFRPLIASEEDLFLKLFQFQLSNRESTVERGEKLIQTLNWSIPLAFALIALFSIAMATFIGKAVSNILKHINQNLGKVSGEIGIASGSLAQASQKLSQSSAEQASSLQETAASIEEMTSMVGKNAENSVEAKDTADKSQEKATEGQRIVEQMLQSMEDINSANANIQTQMEKSNQQMNEIVKIIEDIGNRTQVINDIVFQTKLLSFNASVEAARAGEYGKGFAVVAEEVGNLAEMSGKAATEISAMLQSSKTKVSEIAAETQEKVSRLIQEGKKQVESGTDVARQCGEVLGDIVENINRVSMMSSEISHATKEQSAGITEINKAVGQLEQVTQSNSAASEQVASAADQLSSQADIMKDVVEKMKGAIEGAKSLNDLETSDSRTQKRRTQKTGSASISSSSGNFKMSEDESDSWRKGA